MNLTLAVSGINAADNPGPGSGIARSLKESRLNTRIIGLAYDVMEPGIYMDWLIDKSYIMPYPSSDTESYLSRLLYIHQQEKIDILIPALDVEIPLFSKYRSVLENVGIKLLLPTTEAFAMRDKTKIPTFAPKIGLKAPETRNITTLVELDKAIEQFEFPMVIKGQFYEAYKVKSRGDAIKQFYHISAKWGLPVIAQQFIEGDEYNLIGLGDGQGNDMGAVATKKMTITNQGKIWTNVSIRNDKIFVAAHKFVQTTKWGGGFELEIMMEARTGELYLIEINPRFPAWIYMATGCGINLCERLVKLLMGQEYETHSEYEAGRTLIRYTAEMIKSIADLETLSINGESK